jgi:hypothetical protein
VNFRRIAVATVLAQLMVTVAIAQIATYDPSSGVMCVDTQGTDIVAIFITGPDVSVAGCELCDGMNLPGSDALAGTSTWTVGRSAGSTQWIRTNPLVGRGFVGSIGEFFIDGNGVSQDWPEDIPPFLDFPDPYAGIANYGPGLTPSDFGEATFASDAGSSGGGNGSVVFGHCNASQFGPQAQDDFYETALGSVLEVSAPGVLGNDFDPQGDPIFATLVEGPLEGDVALNSDGSFSYLAPSLGTVSPGAIDSFTYRVDDGGGSGSLGTVSITLTVPEPNGWLPVFGCVAFGFCRRRRT